MEEKQREEQLLDDILYSDDDMVYEHNIKDYEDAGAIHYDDFDEDDLEPDDEQENREKMSLREILFYFTNPEMPSAMKNRIFMEYVAAAGVACFCVFCTIFYGEISYLIGFVLSGLLIYQGMSTTLEYVNDRIEEVVVICTSITQRPMRNKTVVSFRTDDSEHPAFFTFEFPGKKASEFQLNGIYVLYVKLDNDSLVSYRAL